MDEAPYGIKQINFLMPKMKISHWMSIMFIDFKSSHFECRKLNQYKHWIWTSSFNPLKYKGVFDISKLFNYIKNNKQITDSNRVLNSRLNIRPRTISREISKLVKRGFVTRKYSKGGYQCTRTLSITTKGENSFGVNEEDSILRFLVDTYIKHKNLSFIPINVHDIVKKTHYKTANACLADLYLLGFFIPCPVTKINQKKLMD